MTFYKYSYFVTTMNNYAIRHLHHSKKFPWPLGPSLPLCTAVPDHDGSALCLYIVLPILEFHMNEIMLHAFCCA